MPLVLDFKIPFVKKLTTGILNVYDSSHCNVWNPRVPQGLPA
jgi:hypothetical protein